MELNIINKLFLELSQFSTALTKKEIKLLVHESKITKRVKFLEETGKDLINKMCELCKIINPQHKGCHHCDEKDNYDKIIKEQWDG